MASGVNPIPEGYHTATPYLIMKGASDAIEYYKQAFGAMERFRVPGPDGLIGHAEISIGDSTIALADEVVEMGFKGPKTFGGSPISLMLYVTDVDAVFASAIAAGGKEVRPVENQFYGDRTGSLEDPFGHSWYISTHVEDVPPDELERRAAEMVSQEQGHA